MIVPAMIAKDAIMAVDMGAGRDVLGRIADDLAVFHHLGALGDGAAGDLVTGGGDALFSQDRDIVGGVQDQGFRHGHFLYGWPLSGWL